MRKLTKRFMAAVDALATGFTVGEKLSEGERMKAIGMGLALAAPLIIKRRVWSLAGAVAMAVVAYYFWEEFHAREPVLVEAPADPAMN